jgi:DNA polymerase III alpha subunit
MEFIPAYIERRHGREEIEYLYPDLRLTLTKKYGEAVAEEERTKLIEDLHLIMKDTYGIAVYQEQLMFLVQAMAGFSLGEADVLRRGIGKKKKEIIEKLKQEFIEKGAAFRGYKPETTKEIYERMIEPAAQYSFNKSHAVCYALIAYQTAYLKAHYPVEFYAALVRSVEEDTDTQSFYISEIQYHGIAVYPPDVNISFNHVAAIDDSVRIGFSSIKGVGVEVGETIQQERQKNGKFTSLEDFCKRCDSVLNKKSLDGIIKAGALDTFADRNVLWENSDIILNRIKNSANADQGLFGGMETNITLKKADSSTLMERLMMEQEVFKAFISGNPLDGLYRYIKKNTLFSQIKDKTDVPQFISICYIKDIQRARKKGFFIKVEDITETFEFFVADPCGLEKFDVLILHGLKRNNRVQITKVIKTSRKRLKELAGSSYDENDTVVNVKKARYGEQKQAELEQIKKGTDTEQQKMVVKEMVVKDVERDEDAESEEEIVEEIPSDIPACDCESVAETEIISEVEDTTSETEITAEAEKEPETAPDTNVLLEHAKEILNEIVDPTLPLVIDVSLLKTVENIRYVAELIKANPGERRATIL